MTVENNNREFVGDLQKELAKVDPTIMEFDLDDPDSRLAIMLTAAILKGSSIELISEREDGEKEVIALESLGSISDGPPSIVVSLRSTDGTLAPDTAELVAGLLDEAHQEEINQLVSE